MPRFPLFLLLLLAACGHTPEKTPETQPALFDMTLDQDWREATDCVMREMEQGGLKRWPLRASSQAASFDFKGERSKIVVRNTEDMAALYTATLQKSGEGKTQFSVAAVHGAKSSLNDLVEADLRRAAQNCE